jgi:hypothetical protein
MVLEGPILGGPLVFVKSLIPIPGVFQYPVKCTRRRILASNPRRDPGLIPNTRLSVNVMTVRTLLMSTYGQ